jgi:DHA3 family macrolide efflux protein-like MFS transporter
MTTSKTGMVTVLKNRNFLALWLGQLVSRIGDNFAIVAALVLINELAGAPGLATVVIAAAMTLPQLFAPFSGVLVDRFSRKTVMIVTNLLQAGIVVLPLLVHRSDQLYILYLTAFFLMGVGAMFVPARNASIPNMVPEEHLLTANALIQATELASLIAGASLATLVISLTSTSTAFVIDSASFIISALLLWTVHIPRVKPSTVPSLAQGELMAASELRKFWETFVDGVRYIASNKHLLQLMAITTVATLGLSATVLLAAAYFKELLGISAQYLGLLQATEGVGMALGALLISMYASWARSRQIVSVTMIVLGGGILAFALTPVYWLVLVGALVIGLCVVSARTTLAAMTQALVPDSQRGRVESAMIAVISLGTMGALAMAGILGDVVGPKSVFLFAGLIVLAAGIASIFTLRGAEQILLNSSNGQHLSRLE